MVGLTRASVIAAFLRSEAAACEGWRSERRWHDAGKRFTLLVRQGQFGGNEPVAARWDDGWIDVLNSLDTALSDTVRAAAAAAGGGSRHVIEWQLMNVLHSRSTVLAEPAN